MHSCDFSNPLDTLDTPVEVQLRLFDSFEPAAPHANIESLRLASDDDAIERRLIVFSGYALGTVERRYSRKNRAQLTGIQWRAATELVCVLSGTLQGSNTSLHATEDPVALVDDWMTRGPSILRKLRRNVEQSLPDRTSGCEPRSTNPSPENVATLHELVSILLLDSARLARLFSALSELNPEDRRLLIGTIVRAPIESARLWEITPAHQRGAIPFMLSVGIANPWRRHHHRGKRVDELIRRMRHLPLSAGARICITAGWPRSWYLSDLVGVFLPLMRHWWRTRQKQSEQTLEGLMQAFELLRRAQHVRRVAPSDTLIDASDADALLGIPERTDIGRAIFDNMLRAALEDFQGIGIAPRVSTDELARALHKQAWRTAGDHVCIAQHRTFEYENARIGARLLKDTATARAYRAVYDRLGEMHPDIVSFRNGASIRWRCLIVAHRAEWEETMSEHANLIACNLARVSGILCERHTMMLQRSMYATQEEDAGGHAGH